MGCRSTFESKSQVNGLQRLCHPTPAHQATPTASQSPEALELEAARGGAVRRAAAMDGTGGNAEAEGGGSHGGGFEWDADSQLYYHARSASSP